MSKLVWLLLLHIVPSTNTVHCFAFLEAVVCCSIVESDHFVLFIYLGIPGLSLVCSRLLLGEPNRHDWSQQLEWQREPCRGHGEDERLGRQARRQWCRGGVEPWYWTELSGGPGHLSSLWTQEDHPVWWGKDVWWVQMWELQLHIFLIGRKN